MRWFGEISQNQLKKRASVLAKIKCLSVSCNQTRGAAQTADIVIFYVMPCLQTLSVLRFTTRVNPVGSREPNVLKQCLSGVIIVQNYLVS